MRFCILVQSPPSSSGAFSALQFTTAALKKGHEVIRVFFSGEAVGVANANNTYPQDERDLGKEWSQLAQQHQLDLVVCVSAALKRGVLDEGEAQRYEKNLATILPAFTISGMGQLIESATLADRIVTFGG